MSVSTKSYTTSKELASYISGKDPNSAAIQQNIAKIASTKTNGIEALPYQFLDTVDRRITNTEIGRKYGDKIFSRMPLLFLTPCEPLFMDNFDQGSKNAVTESLLRGTGLTKLGDIIAGNNNGVNRYYSTSFAYTDYYKYLNTMMACLAVYLGLWNTKIYIQNKSKKIGKIDWSNELNSAFKTFFTAKENLIFYLDEMNTVTESFENGTTESALASQINQFADMSNEIRFLFGKDGNVASQLIASGSDVTSSISSGLSGLAQGIGGGIVGSLANKGVNSVLNGGKIVFPKIWSDSSFSRGFSLDIKLRSPDHDDLSIYLNILKPYCKLLALVMPRRLDMKGREPDPNSYGAPFLVRAYCKGLFNIDMGMITSMSVSKGKACAWNDNGLPTEIDISLTIEDLYSSIAMSKVDIKKKSTPLAVASNTSYMDFLANMAGLNIGKMEIGRRVEMTYYLSNSAVSLAPSTVFTKFDQGLTNMMANMYNILS